MIEQLTYTSKKQVIGEFKIKGRNKKYGQNYQGSKVELRIL